MTEVLLRPLCFRSFAQLVSKPLAILQAESPLRTTYSTVMPFTETPSSDADKLDSVVLLGVLSDRRCLVSVTRATVPGCLRGTRSV